MEVVGVVAAIPGLIQIVQGLAATVQGLTQRKAASKVAADLLLQLQDFEDMLKDVQKRWRQNPAGQSRLSKLSPVLTQLRAELSSLQDTLKSSKLKQDPSKFFRRAIFLSTSFDKTLKESLSRLSQAKTSLTLIIADHHDSVAKELLEISISELRLKLRALLRPSGDSFIPTRLDQTCQWIWSHPVFNGWRSKTPPTPDHSNRILCLYGTKGCGKSVLVKSVAETLRDQGEVVLHFSFWASSEAQRKLLDLLRTILWQLLSRLPDDEFQRLSMPLIPDSSINERNISEAINKALDFFKSDVYCTIDGIDESIEDWNNPRDRCMQTALELVKKHPKLHMLLSGREPCMRTLLKEGFPMLEVTESLVREDIHRFIAVELNNSLPIQNQEVKALAQRALESKSQVMFLWTTLVLRELRRCFSVEEIKRTLNQVPHGLDREYHRLFKQLMSRTGGSLTKPSVAMKRARGLLSIILACPEPLTAEELCYAYAAQEATSGTIEDNLIAVDGITDACGDFLRVTDGRYHLAHNSAEEFLSRPLDEWGIEDSEIVYFRVDPLGGQRSMCSACFRYIRSLDLGYPLTDDDPLSLPERYPFFCYAIWLLPFHFAKVLKFGDTSWGNAEASCFIRSRQFCAIVEYVIVLLRQSLPCGDMEYFYYWMELLDVIFEWPVLEFVEACENELQRRRRCFGTNDDRYQSWQGLHSLFFNGFRGENDVQSLPTDHGRGNKLAMGMNQVPVVALPQDLTQSSLGKMVQGVHAVSSILRGCDLTTLLMDALPVPMIYLMVETARLSANWPRAHRFASMMAKKSRDKGDLFEAVSLIALASTGHLHFCKCNDICGDQDQNLLQRAVRILDQLPPQPLIQFYKIDAFFSLTLTYVRGDREVEASESLHRFKSLFGRDRDKCDSRLWEFCIDTRGGSTLRLQCLNRLAATYLEFGKYAEVVDLVDEAMAIHEKSKFKGKLHRSHLVNLLVVKSNELIDDLTRIAMDLALLGEYTRSASTSRKLLEIKGMPFQCKTATGEFENLTTLVDGLQRLSSILPGYGDLLHYFSLLEAAVRPGDDLSAEASWWEDTSEKIQAHCIPSFRQHWVLPCLKYVDMLLSRDGDVHDIWWCYYIIATFYSEAGDPSAAELVLNDGASRCFANQLSGISRGLILSSQASICRGDFSKGKSHLSEAYESLRDNEYPDTGPTFPWETFFVEEYMTIAQQLMESSDQEDLRLTFVESAWAHWVRAREAMEKSRVSHADGQDQEDGATEIEQPDRETLITLETQLRTLGGGHFLSEITVEENEDPAGQH